MVNPRICKHLSSLPDRSQDVSLGLTTGEKWTKHPEFQHPQITVNSKDFCVGDVVELLNNRAKLLVKSFFRQHGTDLVDGYYVLEGNNVNCILPNIMVVPKEFMVCSLDKSICSRLNCFTGSYQDGNGI